MIVEMDRIKNDFHVEQHGSITCVLGDCMDVMKYFKDEEFDLAIIDAPYGIGECGDKNGSRSKLAVSQDYEAYSGKDKEPPTAEYMKELFRVSKNQIIWGANHFISNIPAANSPCWIVWDKDNGNTDFADCELAWTSFSSAVRRFKWRWQGMLQQNMKNKQIRIHPNEKPIELYKWILNTYGEYGYKILDTHSGSLSIGIACHDLGYDLTAIEKHRGYYEKGAKRLKTHQKQQILEFES